MARAPALSTAMPCGGAGPRAARIPVHSNLLLILLRESLRLSRATGIVRLPLEAARTIEQKSAKIRPIRASGPETARTPCN
jgi:hypothetical protein